MLKSQFFQNQQRPLIFGHRGVVMAHQENTLAGFQQAIALGIDGVELDTFLTKDGELVVFHDLHTKRLTGVSGKISEMTWREIQQLRIKERFNLGKTTLTYPQPEKIPLLAEVLALTKGKLIVNIELKAPRFNVKQHQIGIAVANLIKEMNLEQDVFVTSFNLWSLIWLKLTYPAIESGVLYSPVTQKNPYFRKLLQLHLIEVLLDARLVSMHQQLFKEDTIAKLHQKELAVGAWTIFAQQKIPKNPLKYSSCNLKQHSQELATIQRLIAQNIDYLITDDPAQLQAILSPKP